MACRPYKSWHRFQVDQPRFPPSAGFFAPRIEASEDSVLSAVFFQQRGGFRIGYTLWSIHQDRPNWECAIIVATKTVTEGWILARTNKLLYLVGICHTT